MIHRLPPPQGSRAPRLLNQSTLEMWHPQEFWIAYLCGVRVRSILFKASGVKISGCSLVTGYFHREWRGLEGIRAFGRGHA